MKNIKGVGFDLDQTLYPNNSLMTDRIKNEVAKKILLKKPELSDLQTARRFLDEQFAINLSLSKTLKNVGYENYYQVRDDCLALADILGLINEDRAIVRILLDLSKKYKLFLLTHSPKELALKKLLKIGIDPNIFAVAIFSDVPGDVNKTNGTAFKLALEQLNLAGSDCLFVGDSKKSDILPAKSFGMKTVSVYQNISEADFFLDTIYKIEGLLL